MTGRATPYRVRTDGYRVVNWRHKLRVTVNPDGTQTLTMWKLPVWEWRRRA